MDLLNIYQNQTKLNYETCLSLLASDWICLRCGMYGGELTVLSLNCICLTCDIFYSLFWTWWQNNCWTYLRPRKRQRSVRHSPFFLKLSLPFPLESRVPRTPEEWRCARGAMLFSFILLNTNLIGSYGMSKD